MDRFWSKVDKSGDCWEWRAGLDDHDYGQFRMGNKNFKAHRAAWILTHGENPTQDILHSCDNRKCVRPDHLRLGSDTDNMRDSLERERRNLLFSNADVAEMRKLARLGKSRQELVDIFGGTRLAVTLAVTGQTFKHVEEPPAEFIKKDKSKSKLTLEQVIEIKRELLAPYWGQNKAIAKRYGLTPSEVSHIKFGYTYADVSIDK